MQAAAAQTRNTGCNVGRQLTRSRGSARHWDDAGRAADALREHIASAQTGSTGCGAGAPANPVTRRGQALGRRGPGRGRAARAHCAARAAAPAQRH